MVTAVAVGGGGMRGRRRDWRARHRCSAGGSDDDSNDGNDGDEVDAPVVVRHVAVLLLPCAPPLDGDGDDGGGRWGWREGASSRLARVALELGLLHHRDSNDSENNGDVVM